MNKSINWWDETDKIVKREPIKMFPASSLSPSHECILLLEHFEGFSPTAYLDNIAHPPVWTLGHGFTKGVKEGDTITHSSSVKRKLVEVDEHWDGIKGNIDVLITQDMCDALSSWAYNVGVGAVRRSTLIRVLNDGDYDEASEQLLRWNKAGGKVVAGLTRRRNAEREMFLGNDWRKYYV